MSVELTLRAEVRGSLSVYPVTALRELGVDVFVSDRFGGVSEAPYESLNLGGHVGDDGARVRENRARVAAAAGVEPAGLVIARQVHGDTVLDVAAVTEGAEADGLLTTSNELALCVLVADCVPIVLVDESTKCFATVHAGWRGLEKRILERAVSMFARSQTLHAFLGPAISFEGYQVGPEVAALFEDVPGAVRRDVGDRSRLDLRGVAAHQLRRLGLDDERISISTQVTDGGEMFFSDRAQRPTGRFALVAKRAP
jgi:polyphenol oxidase